MWEAALGSQNSQGVSPADTKDWQSSRKCSSYAAYSETQRQEHCQNCPEEIHCFARMIHLLLFLARWGNLKLDSLLSSAPKRVVPQYIVLKAACMNHELGDTVFSIKNKMLVLGLGHLFNCLCPKLWPQSRLLAVTVRLLWVLLKFAMMDEKYVKSTGSLNMTKGYSPIEWCSTLRSRESNTIRRKQRKFQASPLPILSF